MQQTDTTLSLDLIQTIAQKTEVKLYDVLKILHIISSEHKIANSILVQQTGIPKTQMGRILSFLSPFLNPPSPFVVLKEEVQQEVKELVDRYYITSDDPAHEQKIRAQVHESHRARPTPIRDFDQFLATDQTVTKRACYLLDQGELVHTKVLFLGDDDHTSLAVASVAIESNVTVLDIDERILNSISDMSKSHQYGIETIRHDLRKPLPKDLLDSFDVVFTDPPYTPSGITLFINQGLSALKKQSTSRLYFCYGTSDRARERELAIQSIITEHGLLIHEKLFHFNAYTGAESIGGSSSLVVCKLTPQTQFSFKEVSGIYTNSHGPEHA